MSGIGTLFSVPKTPTPATQPVVRMADRGDPKLQEEAERKRRMRQEQSGGGRDATVMTGPAEPYGSSELGK